MTRPADALLTLVAPALRGAAREQLRAYTKAVEARVEAAYRAHVDKLRDATVARAIAVTRALAEHDLNRRGMRIALIREHVQCTPRECRAALEHALFVGDIEVAPAREQHTNNRLYRVRDTRPSAARNLDTVVRVLARIGPAQYDAWREACAMRGGEFGDAIRIARASGLVRSPHGTLWEVTAEGALHVNAETRTNHP